MCFHILTHQSFTIWNVTGKHSVAVAIDEVMTSCGRSGCCVATRCRGREVKSGVKRGVVTAWDCYRRWGMAVVKILTLLLWIIIPLKGGGSSEFVRPCSCILRREASKLFKDLQEELGQGWWCWGGIQLSYYKCYIRTCVMKGELNEFEQCATHYEVSLKQH